MDYMTGEMESMKEVQGLVFPLMSGVGSWAWILGGNMLRFRPRSLPVVCSLSFLLVFSCSQKKDASGDKPGVRDKSAAETYLDVHFVLDSTPEELIERFGEPTSYNPEREGILGNLLWKDVSGVRVLAVIKDGQCAYVHYTFKELEPFDENEALQIVGIERPEYEPQLFSKKGAKRWQPFEQYERLTVSPRVKGVSVRAYYFPL